MSLRTSAHTGVAIRFPRRETWQLGTTSGKFVVAAYSPKVLLSAMYCRRGCGLPRRSAPRNDKGEGRPCTRAHVLPSACHCEPVRTLVWQSASPQRNLTSWHYFGQIRIHFSVFALSTALCFVLPQENGLPRRSAPRNDMLKEDARQRLQGGTAGVLPESVLAPVDTPCLLHTLRAPRPCTRAHVPAFCMSLRTSAHTGAAIRFPAAIPGKHVELKANSLRLAYSPKVLLHCYALPQGERIATSLRSSQ